MNTTALKKDWLAGSAVIAFLGALMLAQTWRPPGGVYELPFNLTVPAFPDPMSFTIAALLFFSSFALALVPFPDGLVDTGKSPPTPDSRASGNDGHVKRVSGIRHIQVETVLNQSQGEMRRDMG